MSVINNPILNQEDQGPQLVEVVRMSNKNIGFWIRALPPSCPSCAALGKSIRPLCASFLYEIRKLFLCRSKRTRKSFVTKDVPCVDPFMYELMPHLIGPKTSLVMVTMLSLKAL